MGAIGPTRYAFGRRREHRKRVDWYLAAATDRSVRLERGFAVARWLDRAEAAEALTHEADREVTARAFALLDALR